jgi:hypothetical protein
MAKFRAIAVSVGFLFAGCGCASSTPSAVPAETGPVFVQIDDENLVRIADVRAAEFVRMDPAPGVAPYAIDIYLSSQTAGPLVSVYQDQTQAYDAWNRLATALGGKLHDQRWAVESATTKPMAAPASQPLFGLPPAESNDAYTHLTQQLGWLMKCVDAKLLTDAEYQQGRAWAIADLQANPQGNSNSVQGVFPNGGRPDFEWLYRQLVGLAKSKQSGLLSDEEAAKVRASILKQAGLVE